MNSEPRYVGVSMRAGGTGLFLVAVRARNVPGALGKVTTRMGEAGLNILTTNDCSPPEGPDFTFSFMVEAKGGGKDEDGIRKALLSSPVVTDCLVRRNEGKLLIDDFAFPLMYFPAGRGILLPHSGVTAMFDDILRMFGTGGESILFRAGHAVGKEGTNDVVTALGEEDAKREAKTLTAMYAALGWGRMEAFEDAESPKSFRLKLTDGFESAGAKGGRSGCHFTRGLVAGASERIFGGVATCTEERCAAAGSPYCLFHVTIRERPSRSGSF